MACQLWLVSKLKNLEIISTTRAVLHVDYDLAPGLGSRRLPCKATCFKLAPALKHLKLLQPPGSSHAFTLVYSYISPSRYVAYIVNALTYTRMYRW